MVRNTRKRKASNETEKQNNTLPNEESREIETPPVVEALATENEVVESGTGTAPPKKKRIRKIGPMYQRLYRTIGALSNRLNTLCEEIQKAKLVTEVREVSLEPIDNDITQNAEINKVMESIEQEKDTEKGVELTGVECKQVIYNVRNINLEKPKFGDKELNPVTYLEDLELYLRRAGREGKEIELIQECLVGDARDWARVYQSRWKDLSDFKKDFLKTFWGEKEQNDLRRSIVQGTWDRTTSMLNHFLRITGKAQLLSFKIPEKQLVADLIRQYPKYVQQGWYISKIDTIIETAEFLRSVDDVNKIDSPKQTTPTNAPTSTKFQDKGKRGIQQNYYHHWNRPSGSNTTGKRAAGMVVDTEDVIEDCSQNLN